VSINSSANSLPSGGYEDLVYFTNTSTHEGDTSRSVNLQVGVPSLVYDWDLNSNPGWSTTGDWAWGQPTGGGGQYGNADPTSGHTGSKVYGYNLSGDYGNNLPERHLTTGAIDCSNLSAVSVKFWRWLGVEQSSYDHAYLRVSTNGSSWTTVWENSAEVADSNWSQKEYDLSAIADGEATVFLRWTMGTTDGSWQYCGWNIDDVEIWGVGADDMTSSDDSAPARTALLANFPNPFNPRTEVPFELSESGYVRLSVFDITGRQLKVLESGLLPAGRHQASWDGRAEDGETCSAGVYFIRLETEQHSESRKITLVK
jgi:hypothetical protein